MNKLFPDDEGALPVGTNVIINKDWPEERGRCHIRTPSYVRGRQGQIADFLGWHLNPEYLAFARPAPLKRLYHVRISLSEIWPDGKHIEETLLVEIYEHWLTISENNHEGSAGEREGKVTT